MKDIITCEYLAKGKEALHNEKNSHDDYLTIIQTLYEPGQVVIKNNVYPMTCGGLYFINGKSAHEIIPNNESAYIQSKLVLSKSFVDSLAAALDCTAEINDIFLKDGGFYVPLIHFKTVDSRFKRMFGQYKTDSPYSKALIASDFIALLNYAVYNKSK